MSAAADLVAARVDELLRSYRPPDFAHVPDPDAAIFLCAVDHKAGYKRPHMVGDAGPFRGSELMWAVAIAASIGRGSRLRAASLTTIGADEVSDLFRVDEETVVDPKRRADLWRDLAVGLESAYDGSAAILLESAGGRLGGPGGLLERLAAFRAYEDPLAKKAQLLAKICDRRGWIEIEDTDSWEVSADSVLMRLALRSGLVELGARERVRADTRVAFKRLASRLGVSPALLDDMLWELGREDPDLLGIAGGDLREPPRDPASAWY